MLQNGRDLAKEWCNEVIIAANERVGSQNAKPSTVESSNYSRPLDNTDMYVLEESNTLADELALTLFLYPTKEPKISAEELVFTSFSHLIEDEISADELNYTIYIKPTASKKRPSMGLKNTVSKDPCYSTSTSSWMRQSKK